MYNLKLPNFEGPFDLLLYFIKRDELNIYDIPIAKITEEFLKYIRLMEQFDLELAGEFLVMAATLMYIKTQMLLPQEALEDGSEPEDPRTQLVERLLEYKRYKEAAYNLRECEDSQRYVMYRKIFDVDKRNAAESQKYNYANATLFDLMRAVHNALSKKNEVADHRHIVNIFPVSVEETSTRLLGELRTKKRIEFGKYIAEFSRPVIVVTFLALLDLLRNEKINLYQDEPFDEIIISERAA